MAINYTVSYTFSPSTTISSSQVNTNFSDNANTWTGLEALTKTFSALRVDATPTNAADVVRKDYVDHLMAYRRPVLQYASGTVVNMETGLTGTSGQAAILFPDGTYRTDSTTGRINCNLAQTMSLTGTAQSGIDTGSSSANTWYSFYAVKSQVNTTDIVHVASLLQPTQANFSTLNSRLGSNSWVYLGTVPNGDGAASTTAVPGFRQAGNLITFFNIETNSITGVRLANTAAATTLTWTYAAGTNLGSAQIPSIMTTGSFTIRQGNSTAILVTDSNVAIQYWAAVFAAGTQIWPVPEVVLSLGLKINPGSGIAIEITLVSYRDAVLGVGPTILL